ncbi:hypothetical protein [Ferrovibrio sp.]
MACARGLALKIMAQLQIALGICYSESELGAPVGTPAGEDAAE